MQYAPHEFFAAMGGLNEEGLEDWRRMRYLAWYTIVSQRGTKDFPTLEEFVDPQVKKTEVKREDYDEIFERLKSWTPPLSPE